ncbi:MAG: holo-ACP synthase [Firmicutes bacterium]|nr:holo-ACP synthase [Bacillota bacterium]
MHRIGIDIASVDRLEAAIRRHPQMLARLFSAQELEDAGSGPQRMARLAARFAAKEAFIKAAQGLHGGCWRDIEVRRLPHQAPSLVLYGPVAAWLTSHALTAELSLSHEKAYAAAVVLIAGGCV